METSPDIPIEAVARYPRPGTSIPSAVRFSPDDALVTYLHSEEGSLSRDLFAYDIESGERRRLIEPPGGGVTEEGLSHEEKLRRERTRQRGLGVTRYAWPEDEVGQTLLVPLQGAVYVQDGPDGELRELVPAGEHPALDPRLSPDGTNVAFVRDAELYVVPVEGGEPRQLTRGARGTGRTHGLAEYIAQEEMGRHHGFWWSKDGRWLAFTEVDETHIPVYRIPHSGRSELSHEDHRYPFAGAENAKVRLGVIPASGGRTRWLDLKMEGVEPREDGSQDVYLARVQWLPDGGLAVQLENRPQTRLDLIRFDPQTGARNQLIRESTEVWINLHDMLHPLEHGEGRLENGFLWASERSGFRHLYLYDGNGDLVRQLTKGAWMVDELADVDEDSNTAYFLATKDGVTERHLYAVSLDGGEPRRITQEPGAHAVELDHGFDRFVDRHSSASAQPTVTLRSLEDGSPLATLYNQPDPEVETLGLKPPELVTLKTRDGVTLHGAVYRPERDADRPHPTLVSVYGGPHAQRVVNSWGLTADMRAQYLRSLGYLVFKLDNRGSARRGLAFEGAIKHDMGDLEVQDQIDGVRWLVDRGLTDPERVGIYGWSYGGYMSAMALAQAPETFKLAIAGAPVTHWDGYDTHYTERYMGTPQSNPEGYERSSVMHHVPNMRGKLLLVHGLIDENVHFRHTARLMKALIAQRKHHETLLFPDERHMPRREEDRVYMERRLEEFLREHL